MQLIELYQRAEDSFLTENYVRALQDYLGIVSVAPKFARARYRVADSLLNLGEVEGAKEVYKSLAWMFIQSGHPLMGIVTTKMLLALDEGYTDVLEILCELYSSESDRLGTASARDAAARWSLDPKHDAIGVEVEPPDLIEMAINVAANTDRVPVSLDSLPRVPLFSHLPGDAFGPVLESLGLQRIADGEAIITEGAEGDNFYIVADGLVAVSKMVDGKEVILARLGPGSVFGEMALVHPGPRTATVRAEGEVAVLALSREDAESHAADNPDVMRALRKFTRGRLLANLAATSPLFSGLSPEDRKDLMRSFQLKSVYGGDILIEQGEPGRGIFVITRGDFSVTRSKLGKAKKIAALSSGDVFGEISLIRDEPTTATVTADDESEVLFLPKSTFKQTMQAHPQAYEALRRLSAEQAANPTGSIPKPRLRSMTPKS